DRFAHVRLIEAAHLARVLDVVDRIAADVGMLDAIPVIRRWMQPANDRSEILSQYLRPQRMVQRPIPLHEHVHAKKCTEGRDEYEQDGWDSHPESPRHAPMLSYLLR